MATPKVKLQSFQGGGKVGVGSGLLPQFTSPGKVVAGSGLPTYAGPPAGTGAAPPPATPAPPAAAPGAGGFSPGIAGLYEQTRANIAANLKQKVGAITQAEDAGANEYGFAVKYKPTVGANGEREVESITVDPSNPFSRAAALQRSYDQAKQGATNNYAARGQLYAGSLQNAQNENAYQLQRGDDQLRKAFASFILGQEGQRQAAVAQAAAEGTAAYGTALQQQLATTPSDPGPAPTISDSQAAALAAQLALENARGASSPSRTTWGRPMNTVPPAPKKKKKGGK